jgi:hypothetical protein
MGGLEPCAKAPVTTVDEQMVLEGHVNVTIKCGWNHRSSETRGRQGRAQDEWRKKSCGMLGGGAGSCKFRSSCMAVSSAAAPPHHLGTC